MSTMLLSDQLKEQTAVQHLLLEKQIIPLIKNIRTNGDYAGLLMLFYTFFGGLELLVEDTMNNDCLPDYPQRRKISLMGNDLLSMNVPVQPFANGRDLPKIENHLHAFGAMYVMEGSTLGGQHIAKMITDRIQLPGAISFFNGYKNETQNMWQAFKKAMDAMATDVNEKGAVVNAANDTFTRFGNWIRQQ